MFVVDTNILLYAVNPDAPDHAVARALLEDWRRGDRACFLTWGIIYEFLRVSTHHRIFPQPLPLPAARAWIEALLSSANVGVLTETDRHADVLTDTVARHARVAGNLVHDFHIAVLMREHGIAEIRTADADFHQFDFLRVVNPLDKPA